MFRRSASLAIPHRKSFAAILFVSRVLLGHMNRSVSGERKKHIQKTHIKNFRIRGGQGAGLGGRFRGPNSLCWCHFSQQNTAHKEFKGGVSQGLRGWGCLRSNFGGHYFMFMSFSGLEFRCHTNRSVKLPQLGTFKTDSFASQGLCS